MIHNKCDDINRLMEEMFMSISQKDAVVNEVKSILGSSFDPSTPARDQLNDDHLQIIKSNVVSGIINGSVEFKKETSDEKEIARYVSGMVSNHLRKAKELNGGTQYTAQSSGRGSRDPQISELNKLLKTYSEGTDEFNQIVSAIESRKAEFTAERTEQNKSKKKAKELSSIDMDVLPEGLKELAHNLVSQANAQ